MKRPIVIILLAAAMLFVLAGIATVVIFTVNGFQTNNPLDRVNISSVLEESKTLKVDADEPVTLTVNSESGNVSVTGGDVESVQVRVIKTAYDSSQSRADEEVKTIEYSIEQSGNNITLKYELPKSMNIRNKVNTVDFIVTVPSEVNVNVDAGFGKINISDTTGPVNIAGNFGGVIVENVQGKLTVETGSGEVDASAIRAGGENIELKSGFGKVSLEEASGKDITLTSQSGSVTMRNVRASGNIEMSTDFGDIDFTSGSGSLLSVTTNSGRITLEQLNLRGALTGKSEFGEIELEQVKAASYDLDTNSGSVTVDGAAGKVKAHSGFGSVTVRNADAVTVDLSTQSGSVTFEGSLGAGPHSVRSEFGDIHLTIPADSALNVDLKTEFGSINSDIPVTVIISGETEKGHQTGTMNGGGEQLTVETKSGGVSLEASQ